MYTVYIFISLVNYFHVTHLSSPQDSGVDPVVIFIVLMRKQGCQEVNYQPKVIRPASYTAGTEAQAAAFQSVARNTIRCFLCMRSSRGKPGETQLPVVGTELSTSQHLHLTTALAKKYWNSLFFSI